MKYDKTYILKEFLRSYFNERYFPYNLFYDFCREEYEYRKEEENIEEEFDEWIESNGEFMNEIFWEWLKDYITNETFGEGYNRFIIVDYKEFLKLEYLNDIYDYFKIKGFEDDWIKSDGVCINIKTGEVWFEEEVTISENVELLLRWVKWKNKQYTKYAIKILSGYFIIDYVKECNNDYMIFENRDNIIKIYRNKEKIEFIELEDDMIGCKDILKSIESPKNAILYNL